MANVMKPTAEILERISIQSRNNREEVFTRLYRYMLRPDIYYQAYKNLYANAGAGTNGIDDDTADGFGAEKVARIIVNFVKEATRLSQFVELTFRKRMVVCVRWVFQHSRISWCRKCYE